LAVVSYDVSEERHQESGNMSTSTPTPALFVRLNPAALGLAFGVAGAVVVILLGGLISAMWGMMAGGGWMHGSAGGASYGDSMMGGGLGFVGYALVCGFSVGALAGGVSASVYNYVSARNVV
jgi:hypothetical protein